MEQIRPGASTSNDQRDRSLTTTPLLSDSPGTDASSSSSKKGQKRTISRTSAVKSGSKSVITIIDSDDDDHRKHQKQQQKQQPDDPSSHHKIYQKYLEQINYPRSAATSLDHLKSMGLISRGVFQNFWKFNFSKFQKKITFSKFQKI